MKAKLVLFGYGDLRFALSSVGILHILPTAPVHPLPLLRFGFTGVLIYRDQPVPFFDLKEIFPGRQAFGSPPQEYTVICGTDSGMIAIPASRVVQIVEVDQGVLGESSEGDESTSPFDMVFWFHDERFLLLDLDDLLVSLPGSDEAAPTGIKET